MNALPKIAAEPPGTALPVAVIHYLTHTELGRSIREIARHAGCHASTISRQVRRFESRRDDPLIDEALDRLGQKHFARFARSQSAKEPAIMSALTRIKLETSADLKLEAAFPRVLRRLAESGAVLAVAKDMERAVIVRDLPGGASARTAAVDRAVAEAMALKDWIACRTTGRISRYAITPAGRAALKRMLAEEEQDGFAEAMAPFGVRQRETEQRDISVEGARAQRGRFNLAESPLAVLGRRRDKDGQPFLSNDLVAAGERLREDFELAQMGPRVTQNWESFLTGGERPSGGPGAQAGFGPQAARDRVQAALRDLGPGLGDVVLRCCCYLEGMESCERRLGWSARSGKVVLRIALQRLKRHYEETHGKFGPLIG
ncbi:DUF6456 domain-containing protein [Mangrovicoccus algicola]|uniref:Helix-turn-helix domain-containing protein n=1 Tax=Mangrovicoccus algicola TaxID=2771008 RepID=A0A8J7CK88_9RHOB|nr:DUF6456 domain-containing protein [Mangrovicoccus algicola]MBE3638461.1 helix-turn-helix domain-containing protein [Mangrovicoccus algicola]